MRTLPFLWEIGCEEIPADWLPGILSQLRAQFGSKLGESGLGDSNVEVDATLRRLVVHVPRVLVKQPDREEQVTGPPARIARAETGDWTQAALGFARKNRIDPDDLRLIETPKGPYVGFVRKVKGRPAIQLLASVMADTLRSIGFPKFMNWDAEIPDGRGAFPFGRPIRWMVCLLGDRVVPFEIRVGTNGNVKAGRKTRGHRFLAPKGRRPGSPFAVGSFGELKRELKKHFVLLNRNQRRERLEREIEKLRKKAGAEKPADLQGLTTEFLADLVEWPGAVLGTYPEEFSSLPEDVRHTVLIHHQKYVPLEGRPAFIAVTNMPSDPRGFIRRGTERVVVARLRDAKFFWDEDLKKPLGSRKEALAGVSFHENLGSYAGKLDRMIPLCRWLAENCGAPAGPVERAAELAKCDLTTSMVGEFPELQGVMGGLYAREQGEPEEVWKAVYSHYRPLGLGDDRDFPLNRGGVLVSLADKLDTLAAMFSVGVVPTGSRDPFGLRRLALGCIRLLLESEERVGLAVGMTPRALLDRAMAETQRQMGHAVDPRADEAVSEFFVERLRFVFGRDFRYDEVNAVFALGALDSPVTELARRLKAVATQRGSSDFKGLSAAFKRVRNILQGAATISDKSSLVAAGTLEVSVEERVSVKDQASVQEQLFVEEAERALWSAFQAVEPEASEAFESGRYADALRTLSRLRPHVDRFFDEVLVMAPDGRLRGNRLALLQALDSQFTRLADLSEIVADAD